MGDTVPALLRLNSLVVPGLSVVFWLFFDQTKHLPALAAILPFGDDPYDAVGSFGIQLALFAALLSLLRTFRLYDTHVSQGQVSLLVRAQLVAALAVAVTLSTDLVAMARYRSMWESSSAAGLLAWSVVGMVLLTGLVGWLILRGRPGNERSAGQRAGLWAWTIVVLSLVVLAVYPVDWRETIPGAIFTAALGMAILFLATWALASIILPSSLSGFNDILDDAAAVYSWLKAHAAVLHGPLGWLEKLVGSYPIRAVLKWLNPRRHAWNLVLLAAICSGFGLALAEALGEGLAANARTVALVLTIFVGMEAAAILLGYVLFTGYLGIFRKESG